MPKFTTDALIHAPWYVHIHLALSLAAVVIGTLVLVRTKGTSSHKAFGWAWSAFMVSTALISFLIQGERRLSLIHLLSVLTLITVPLGIFFIRSKRVLAHQLTMCATFAGLVIAGAFTMLPHRILGQLIFGAR